MRATTVRPGFLASDAHRGADAAPQGRRLPAVRPDAGAPPGVLRAMRFPGGTVPAMKLDGTRLQGTTNDLPRAGRARPVAAAVPARPGAAARGRGGRGWGDEVLQPVPRRIVWNALKHDRSELATYLEGAKTGIPVGLAARMAPPVAALARRVNNATDENVRRDLDALPGLIDRVDELIERGVIGGDERNAADFQIATSVQPPADDGRHPAHDRGPPRRAARARRSCRTSRATRRASSQPDARSVGTSAYARQSTWKQPLHSGSRTSA